MTTLITAAKETNTAYLALEKYLCSFQACGMVIIAGMSTDISHRALSRTAELHWL